MDACGRARVVCSNDFAYMLVSLFCRTNERCLEQECAMLDSDKALSIANSMILAEVVLLTLWIAIKKPTWQLSSFLTGTALAVLVLLNSAFRAFPMPLPIISFVLILVAIHAFLWLPCGIFTLILVALIRKSFGLNKVPTTKFINFSNAEFRLLLIMSLGGLLVSDQFAVKYAISILDSFSH